MNARFHPPISMDEAEPAPRPAPQRGPVSSLAAYLAEFHRVMSVVSPDEISALVELLSVARDEGRLVLIIGNGGSGANASHFSQDLSKATVHDLERQERLRALSLSESPSAISAWANDTSFDRIFEEQLRSVADARSVVVAISGSGASPNIVRAVEYANARGMITVGVTGFDGGTLRKIARHTVHVPSFNIGLVEGAHSVIFHFVVDVLSHRFQGR